MGCSATDAGDTHQTQAQRSSSSHSDAVARSPPAAHMPLELTLDSNIGCCFGLTQALPIPPPVVEALTAWKEQTRYAHPENWVFASEFHFGKQPLWPGTLWRRNVAPA